MFSITYKTLKFRHNIFYYVMRIKAHVEELKEMKKYSPSIYIRMQRKRPSHFLKNVEKVYLLYL